MSTCKKPRRIISNDDGWILSEYEPPVTDLDLKARMIDTYKNTQVGALLWCVGSPIVCSYETEVGEVYGEGFTRFDSDAERWRVENIRHLIETQGGPLTALTKLCHESSMDIFPSVRMNSHYATDVSGPSYGRIRRDHPELLIGRPGEILADGSLEWGIRTGLDYSHPEVRNHVAAMVEELIEKFNVNGVELDYMRHPAFFRVDEAYENRHYMTQMLRDIRRRMLEIGQTKGRDLELAVRVPPTLEDSARIGLDVKTWMADGLVDIVTVGGGFIPFEAKTEEFVEASKSNDCLVYGCIEHLRPAVDEQVIRAIATRFWNAGVAGIHLFNYFGKTAEWKRRILDQIADPTALSRLDKRYHMDNTDRITIRDLHDYSFRYAVPEVQLPIILPYNLSMRGIVLNLRIDDDIETANAEGAIAQCILNLKLDYYRGEDELEIWLNGDLLSSGSSKVSFVPWTRLEWTEFPTRLAEVSHDGGIIEFSLEYPSLRQGDNDLEVRLIKRTVTQPNPIVIRDVEVIILYRYPQSMPD